MINSLFGPIFFVSIGLEVNARYLQGGIGFFLLLLLIAVVGKIAGCGLGVLFSGFTRRESLVVGVGMIPRGEVGLITASLGLAAGLVSHDLYAQVVVLVLITTLNTPPLLRYAFPRETASEAVSDAVLAKLEELPAGAADIVDG